MYLFVICYLGMCYAREVLYWACGILIPWGCWRCGMLGELGYSWCWMTWMWDVRDVRIWWLGCSVCGMFGMWNVGSVGCSGYGMWDVCRDVGCWFTKWRKFKIDEMSYSKSQCRATYYVTKNKPSKYPYVTYTKMQVMFWIKVWYCPAISESAKLSITQEICLF